ncbi:MAG: sister chromatid cohesion protein PDS5 [Coleofasciculus sp.]|uniref:sister chromatid cohesion protein PDS5 n=1 Tax=Coleofasciculus sp. TaxID=3100458 RepID=UPI003A19490E
MENSKRLHASGITPNPSLAKSHGLVVSDTPSNHDSPPQNLISLPARLQCPQGWCFTGKKAWTTQLAIATTILCLVPLFGVTRNTWAQEPTKAEIASEIENLKKADEFLVEDAVDALRKLGSPAIPQLIEALQSENLQVRQGAVDALGKIGKAAIPDLLEGLKSDKEQVRWSAANGLGNIGSQAQDAIPDLIEALQDKEARVRSSAADALGSIGHDAQDAIPDLIETLQDTDARVRSSAASALGNIGHDAKDAVPKLIKALQDQEAQVRSSAADGLGGIGADAKDAVPDLRAALQDSDKDVRRNAAWALGRIGSHAKEVVPDLIQALQDSDKDIRRSAAYALEMIGHDAKEAVPDLIVALKEDKEAQVRSWAADALGAIGAKEAVPQLRVALKEDKEVQVRRSAAWALLKIGVEAKEAVPDLRAALQDSDKYVRGNAAYALGEIGVEAKEAVPDLQAALQDSEKYVRGNAAYGLGGIGADAKETVPDLQAALTDSDTDVRSNAVSALGKIGAEAKETVPELRAILKDNGEDVQVRRSAVYALGGIGADAKETIPDLRAALEEPDKDIRSNAALALKLMADSLQDNVNTLSPKELASTRSELEKALKILEANQTEFSEEETNAVRRAIADLKDQQNAHVSNLIRQNPWAMGVIVYLICVPSLWSILLWLRPLWLLNLNQILMKYTDVIELPPNLGGFKISLRTALMIQFFHYHPRVLDAWVKAHIQSAQAEFQDKETVKNRQVYISMPVTLNGKTLPNLTGKELRPTFKKQRDCLLIWGEGGAGKTSLACQIARWAMSEDETERLCKHQMLPVLIEQDLNVEAADKSPQSQLLDTINGQLQDLIDIEEKIPNKLLERLLRRRRILVIVDHLSEMNEDTRRAICPAQPDFPINSLIVTSRFAEKLGGVTKTKIQPMRVAGNRLSSFMEAYLTEQGKRNLFDDAEYFDACRQLSLMVGQRNITVLLARLFAEQMIAAKEGTGKQDLPDNIPELMLSYLNELNQNVVSDTLDNCTVQKDAKIIAWECLRLKYRPTPAKRQDTLNALGGDEPEIHLNYLKERLGLIQIIGPAQDQIRFAVDPIAEYLAGLHLVDIYGSDEQKWCNFLNKADYVEGTPAAIQGFLLAVRDCCLAQGGVPNFVVEELNQRTGVAATEIQIESQSIAFPQQIPSH